MTMSPREHSRARAWTRDFTIGLVLALGCAVIVMLLAGQAHRLLRASMIAPDATSARGPASDERAATTSATRDGRVAEPAAPASTTSAPPVGAARSAPTNERVGSGSADAAAAAAAAAVAAAAATPPLPDGSAPKVPAPSAEARAATSAPRGDTAASDTAASAPSSAEIDAIQRELQGRRLTIPIPGLAATKLARGSFREERTGHAHEALDILAPRGTPIVAVEDGTIEKLFWSDAGGHTIYQFDPTRRVAYYYAHLDGYAAGLTEGRTVRRGDTIGYVGSSGNARANAPHLHFAIFLLTPQKQWWKGTAIDPYPVFVPIEGPIEGHP